MDFIQRAIGDHVGALALELYKLPIHELYALYYRKKRKPETIVLCESYDVDSLLEYRTALEAAIFQKAQDGETKLMGK